jgi:Uncharacterized Rossmann fold enzyme
MQFPEWESTYLNILSDMGFDRDSDENSARMLKAVTLNSDLVLDDIFYDIVGDTVTVIGNGKNLESDIERMGTEGTIISSGSAVERIMRLKIVPHIIVTDMDGEISSQIDANRKGAIAVLHAHGDNAEMIQRYAPEFEGRVILTTQSAPDNILSNYGGFTDGDRAACLAKHFGAKNIRLAGFDFDDPFPKEGTDPEMKRKKLYWAKKIILGLEDSVTKLDF